MGSLFATVVSSHSLLPSLPSSPSLHSQSALSLPLTMIISSSPSDMDLCVLLEGEEPRRAAAELVTLIGSLLERGQSKPSSHTTLFFLSPSLPSAFDPSSSPSVPLKLELNASLYRPPAPETNFAVKALPKAYVPVRSSPLPTFDLKLALELTTSSPFLPSTSKPIRSSNSLWHHHQASPSESPCVLPSLFETPQVDVHLAMEGDSKKLTSSSLLPSSLMLLQCDIGFENRLALENTRLLLTYA